MKIGTATALKTIRDYALKASTPDIRDHAEALGFARGFTLALALMHPIREFEAVFLRQMNLFIGEFKSAFEARAIVAQDAHEGEA